jgi:hypothetical protein
VKQRHKGELWIRSHPPSCCACRAVVARPGRTLALLILAAVGTVNFVDRQILSVLVGG